MRLLYLSDIRFPLERANGIQTMQTCYALAERGHEVVLLVRRDTVVEPRDPFAFYGLAPLTALRVEAVRTAGAARSARLAYMGSALRHVVRSRPDLVFTRDLGVASTVLRVPARLRPPLVYESHGLADVLAGSLGSLLSTATSASKRKQRRLARRERRVWTRADGYVTITASLARELEERFGRRDHTVVVPDAMRWPDASPPSARTLEVRTRGERGTAPVVAYAGHLYPWKGVDTLIEALGRLASMRGVIVGGHPAESDLGRLQALARQLGLADRVTFTGMVPPADVAGHLARADILVLPNSATAISAKYTSPLKMFEYLAAGKPIVASDLPAIREILQPDVNAVLVPPGDAAQLASGIGRVAGDPALANRLARAARETASAFTWDARARQLEAFFDDVRQSSRTRSR